MKIMMLRGKDKHVTIVPFVEGFAKTLKHVNGILYEFDGDLDSVKVTKESDLPAEQKELSPYLASLLPSESEYKAMGDRYVILQRTLKQARAKADANSLKTAEPALPKTPEEEWRANPKLRAEFIDLDIYKAYVNAKRTGRVRVSGRR